MSETTPARQHAFAEAITSYGPDPSTAPHVKLSISLPTDLVELVREAAAATGLTVSATIGASLRHTLEIEEQERLDRALALDAEENLAWAQAYLPIATRLMSEVEW